MKPVLVLQHQLGDSPAYLGTWLQRHRVPMVVACAQAGEEFPRSIAAFGGLAILGGEMSANDPLQSLRRAESLVREAMDRDIPVIGHCLGGQLMARALGAAVGPSPAAEVGWQPLVIDEHALARQWFGSSGGATVFQWHYEAFDLPRGATRLASSAACPNQAFAIGPHLAMQFHIEVDAAKVKLWSAALDDVHASALQRHPRSVQTAQSMLAGLAREMPGHHALADRLYWQWLGNEIEFSHNVK